MIDVMDRHVVEVFVQALLFPRKFGRRREALALGMMHHSNWVQLPEGRSHQVKQLTTPSVFDILDSKLS